VQRVRPGQRYQPVFGLLAMTRSPKPRKPTRKARLRWRLDRRTNYSHLTDGAIDHATIHWSAFHKRYISNACAVVSFETLKEAKAATEQALKQTKEDSRG
jgi:hypothetical protein